VIVLFLLASAGLANIIVSKSGGRVTCYLCIGFWSGVLCFVPYIWREWQGLPSIGASIWIWLVCGFAGSLVSELYAIIRQYLENKWST
jgi:hypothetical protein